MSIALALSDNLKNLTDILESVKETPPSGSGSTFTSTPGKPLQALPAPRIDPMFQAEYEIEEVDDKDVVMTR